MLDIIRGRVWDAAVLGGVLGWVGVPRALGALGRTGAVWGSCWPIVSVPHLTTYLREQGWRAPESSESPDPWRIPTALGKVNGCLSQGFPSKRLASPPPPRHTHICTHSPGKLGREGRPKSVTTC